MIYDYASPTAEPDAQQVAHINPYLVAAQTVFLPNRSRPLCAVQEMRFGSMPRDGGHLVLSAAERFELITAEPDIEPFVRRYLGSREFLNAGERYCLWLENASPALLNACPQTKARIDAVRKFRLASKAAATRKFAQTPATFCQIAQPESDYLLVPGVSSERRQYAPIGFMPAHVIASNLVFVVPNATSFHFGVYQSAMHMALVRYTCGRLKSDFRYAKDIVYNNFPWPQQVSSIQREAVTVAVQQVLDTRASFPDSTLANLYDPLTMPPALLKAHRALDKAVDAAYGRRKFAGDADRVAFLFAEYARLTSLLDRPKSKRKQVSAG